MTATESPHDVTFGQFTIVFVIAGLLLAWVLLRPEMDGDLELGRTRLTMLASVLLLMPALVLYVFRGSGQRVANLSHLFWTAALIVFIIHTYWGAFIFYDGIADTFLNQGMPLASANFTLLTVWVVDTALLWFAPAHRYGALFHKVVRVIVFALIGLDLIVGRTGVAHTLGFVFVAVVLLAAVVSLAARRVQVTA
jgi:hypothetical protein